MLNQFHQFTRIRLILFIEENHLLHIERQFSVDLLQLCTCVQVCVQKRSPVCLFQMSFSRMSVQESAWENRESVSCWNKGRTFLQLFIYVMLKPLTVRIARNYGKCLKRWEYQTTLTCLLRKLYAGQEATVRTKHETVDWFKLGKGIPQGCILSPCLLGLYIEYFM